MSYEMITSLRRALGQGLSDNAHTSQRQHIETFYCKGLLDQTCQSSQTQTERYNKLLTPRLKLQKVNPLNKTPSSEPEEHQLVPRKEGPPHVKLSFLQRPTEITPRNRSFLSHAGRAATSDEALASRPLAPQGLGLLSSCGFGQRQKHTC